MAAQPEPTLENLAATITQAASAITSYLDANNLPTPSFSENGPAAYPPAPEVQGARFQLLGALSDMMHLALGPEMFNLAQPVYSNHDTMTMDILNQFDFFSAVPLGGSATYSEIARTTTLPEPFVRRILGYAFTIRLFAEAEPGSNSVVHTASTAYLARTPPMRSMIAHNIEEVRLATYHVPESLRKYTAGKPSLSQEISESGFSIADHDKTGHPTTHWEYVKRTPEGKPEGFREKLFSEAMQIAAVASGVDSTAFLTKNYDWAGLGQATVADIGGSSGHDAVALAKAYPNLSLVVQDLPGVEAAFDSYVPKELSSQVTFQSLDFFESHPVSADVYILKTVLHDWPNKYAVKILRNIIPSLKPNSRIVLVESIFPDAQTKASLPPAVYRMLGATDLQMVAIYNSHERTLEQWQQVAKEADERLEVRFVALIPGSIRAILEIRRNA